MNEGSTSKTEQTTLATGGCRSPSTSNYGGRVESGTTLDLGKACNRAVPVRLTAPGICAKHVWTNGGVARHGAGDEDARVVDGTTGAAGDGSVRRMLKLGYEYEEDGQRSPVWHATGCGARGRGYCRKAAAAGRTSGERSELGLTRKSAKRKRGGQRGERQTRAAAVGRERDCEVKQPHEDKPEGERQHERERRHERVERG